MTDFDESPLALLNEVEAKGPRQGKVGECATESAGDQRQRVSDERGRARRETQASLDREPRESCGGKSREIDGRDFAELPREGHSDERAAGVEIEIERDESVKHAPHAKPDDAKPDGRHDDGDRYDFLDDLKAQHDV